jgi:hypothetical protein
MHEGVLYAGGNFQIGSFTNGYHVARLVNGVWQPAGDGLGQNNAQRVRQLLVHNGELYACGSFAVTTLPPLIGPRGFAKWSVNSWIGVGTNPLSGNQGEVFAMRSSGSDLLISGFYALGGSTSVFGRISRFDGTQLTDVSLASSATTSSAVVSFVEFGGETYATANNATNVLALNDAMRLDPVGEGVSEANLGNDRRRLVVIGVSDGTRGNLPAGLILGGQFEQTETLTTFGRNNFRAVNSLTVFDRNLHTPITRSPDRLVNDLVEFQGDMYAVGTFLSAGGVKSNRIAAFDGSRWRAVGDGTGLNDRALTAEVWNNKLVVGGIFTQAGGIAAQRIAAWNGSAWEALGSIPEGAVVDVVDWNGTLLAVCANNVTRVTDFYQPTLREWNGSTWELFGGSAATSNVLRPLVVGTELYGTVNGFPRRWTGLPFREWQQMMELGVAGEPVFLTEVLNGKLRGRSNTREYVLSEGAWRAVATEMFRPSGIERDAVWVDGLRIAVGSVDNTTPPAGWISNGGVTNVLANFGAQLPNTLGQTFTSVLEYDGRVYLAGAMAGIVNPSPLSVTPVFTMAELVLPASAGRVPSFEASGPAWQSVLAGDDVVLRSIVRNGEGLTRSWRRGGTTLMDGLQADGSVVSGATTDELRIANLSTANAGANGLDSVQLVLSGPTVCGTYGRGTTFQVSLLRACDGIDFDNDGMMPSDADVIAFLTVLAGGACPTENCNDIDFDNDGLFPSDADLEAFLRVLAGGSC